MVNFYNLIYLFLFFNSILVCEYYSNKKVFISDYILDSLWTEVVDIQNVNNICIDNNLYYDGLIIRSKDEYNNYYKKSNHIKADLMPKYDCNTDEIIDFSERSLILVNKKVYFNFMFNRKIFRNDKEKRIIYFAEIVPSTDFLNNSFIFNETISIPKISEDYKCEFIFNIND